MQAKVDKEIEQLVSNIHSQNYPGEDQVFDSLKNLRNFECWDAFFKLIKHALSSNPENKIGLFSLLCEAQYQYLEDIFAAAETAVKAIEALDLNYQDFYQHFLLQVLEDEDWSAEATIFQSCFDKFSRKQDQISALERLCLLYEKKVFNETELKATYEMLRKYDPLNVKALRYFKLVYSQNYEWQEVVKVLGLLMQATTYPQDKFRLAQELAGIYLYQLDNPDQALIILDNYCDGSPLDTSTIAYDAYQRKNDWNGCLLVLRECLISLDDEPSRAVLHFKIAQLEERLGNLNIAKIEYEKSISLWDDFLEAIEHRVYISLQEKNWHDSVKWLNHMKAKCREQESKSQINEVLDRINKGTESNDAQR